MIRKKYFIRLLLSTGLHRRGEAIKSRYNWEVAIKSMFLIKYLPIYLSIVPCQNQVFFHSSSCFLLAVPPNKPVVEDRYGKKMTNAFGPFKVGDTIR